MKRGQPTLVAGHHIGAASDQKFGDRQIPRERSRNERGFCVTPALVYVDASVEQTRDSDQIAVCSGIMQRTGPSRC